MAISNSPRFGDLTSFVMTVGGQDLSNNLLDLKIFQDMFCPFMTAIVSIYDYKNVIDSIKVGDMVTVKMSTMQGFDTDGQIDTAFEIYHIAHRTSDTPNQQAFTLYAANKEFMKDLSTRVTQTFQNKKPQEAIKECLKKIGIGQVKTKYKEPKNKITYLAPNVNPMIAAHMALRDTSPKEDYFIYIEETEKNGQGKYRLESLEEIMKQSEMLIFNQSINNLAETRNTNHNLSFKKPVIEQQDELRNLLSGYSASKMHTYDVTKKQWKGKPKKFTNKGEPDAVLLNAPKAQNTFDVGNSLTETTDQWKAKRRRNLFKVLQFPIMFSTFGFCKSWKVFANPVKLMMNHNDADLRTAMANERFRPEKFLVTAVTHHVNAQYVYRNSFRLTSWNLT